MIVLAKEGDMDAVTEPEVPLPIPEVVPVTENGTGMLYFLFQFNNIIFL